MRTEWISYAGAMLLLAINQDLLQIITNVKDKKHNFYISHIKKLLKFLSKLTREIVNKHSLSYT